MSEIAAKVWYDEKTGRLQVTTTALPVNGRLELRHVNFRAESGTGSWAEAGVSVPRKEGRPVRVRRAASADVPPEPLPADFLESVRARAEHGDPGAGWGHATVLRLAGEIDRLKMLAAGSDTALGTDPGEQAATAGAAPANEDAEAGGFVDFHAIEDAREHLENTGMADCADAVHALERAYSAAQVEADRLAMTLEQATAAAAVLAPLSTATLLRNALDVLIEYAEADRCRYRGSNCVAHPGAGTRDPHAPCRGERARGLLETAAKAGLR